MKNPILSGLFVLALFVAGGAIVRGDEVKPLIEPGALDGKLTGTVAFTTEYLSRGVSNTRPGVGAVQGTLEFNHASGAYISVFGSNIDWPPPDTKATLELDYTAGYRGNLTDALNYELSAQYYTYPGAKRADGRTYDYWEFGAKSTYDLDVAQPYLAIYYAPEFQFDSGYEYYFDGGVSIPLGSYFTGLLHAGHSIFQRNTLAESHDYWDYYIGLGTSIAGLDVKLLYITNNLPSQECVGACDRVVATVSKTF